MKAKPIEAFRVTLERAIRMKYPVQLATTEADGRNGLFILPVGREFLRCFSSDGDHANSAHLTKDLLDWEHVSVSLPTRCPTWPEMCAVKDAFFDEEEVVFQLHPKRSEYVNFHPYTLHLWRSKSSTFKSPPSILVGPKTK